MVGFLPGDEQHGEAGQLGDGKAQSKVLGCRKDQKSGTVIPRVSMEKLPSTGPQKRLLGDMPRVLGAVIQMDLDGGQEPWYGFPSNMAIELEVQKNHTES